MPLPVLNANYYPLTLAISNQKIQIRPFLAKEQKFLLMASESKSKKEILVALKNIISSCCEGLNGNIDDLNIVDVETIFLNLRMRSVGEKVTVGLKCPHCEAKNESEIDLTKIELKKDQKHTNKINIGPGIVIQMKYPTLGTIETGGIDDSEEIRMEKIFETLETSIECVYYNDEKIIIKDCSKEEVKTFIESFSTQNLKDISTFFESQPKYESRIYVTCEKCTKSFDLAINNIYDFFS